MKCGLRLFLAICDSQALHSCNFCNGSSIASKRRVTKMDKDYNLGRRVGGVNLHDHSFQRLVCLDGNAINNLDQLPRGYYNLPITYTACGGNRGDMIVRYPIIERSRSED